MPISSAGESADSPATLPKGPQFFLCVVKWSTMEHKFSGIVEKHSYPFVIESTNGKPPNRTLVRMARDLLDGMISKNHPMYVYSIREVDKIPYEKSR